MAHYGVIELVKRNSADVDQRVRVPLKRPLSRQGSCALSSTSSAQTFAASTRPHEINQWLAALANADQVLRPFAGAHGALAQLCGLGSHGASDERETSAIVGSNTSNSSRTGGRLSSSSFSSAFSSSFSFSGSGTISPPSQHGSQPRSAAATSVASSETVGEAAAAQETQTGLSRPSSPASDDGVERHLLLTIGASDKCDVVLQHNQGRLLPVHAIAVLEIPPAVAGAEASGTDFRVYSPTSSPPTSARPRVVLYDLADLVRLLKTAAEGMTQLSSIDRDRIARSVADLCGSDSNWMYCTPTHIRVNHANCDGEVGSVLSFGDWIHVGTRTFIYSRDKQGEDAPLDDGCSDESVTSRRAFLGPVLNVSNLQSPAIPRGPSFRIYSRSGWEPPSHTPLPGVPGTSVEFNTGVCASASRAQMLLPQQSQQAELEPWTTPADATKFGESRRHFSPPDDEVAMEIPDVDAGAPVFSETDATLDAVALTARAKHDHDSTLGEYTNEPLAPDAGEDDEAEDRDVCNHNLQSPEHREAGLIHASVESEVEAQELRSISRDRKRSAQRALFGSRRGQRDLHSDDGCGVIMTSSNEPVTSAGEMMVHADVAVEPLLNVAATPLTSVIGAPPSATPNFIDSHKRRRCDFGEARDLTNHTRTLFRASWLEDDEKKECNPVLSNGDTEAPAGSANREGRKAAAGIISDRDFYHMLRHGQLSCLNESVGRTRLQSRRRVAFDT